MNSRLNDPRRHRPRRTPATIDARATEVRDSDPKTTGTESSGESTASTLPADGPAAAAPPPELSEAGPAAPDLSPSAPEPTSATVDALTLNEAEGGRPIPAEAATEDRVVSEAPALDSAAATDGTAASAAPESGTAAPLGPERVSPDSAPGAVPRGSVPSVSPEPRRFGFGLMAAGLIGGTIGALAALFGAPLVTRSGQERVETRLAALEQRSTAVSREALTGLEQRLAGLERDGAGLLQRLQAAEAAATSAGERAQAALNRSTSPAAPASDQPSAADPGLGPLAERLATLEADVRRLAGVGTDSPAPNTARDGPDRAEIERRIGDLDQRLAAAVQRLGERSPEVASLGQRLGEADARLAAVDRRAGDTDRKLGAVDQRLGAVDQRLGALDQRLAAVAKAVEATPQALAANARVSLTGRLDELLRGGAPLGAVLPALKRLGADAAALAALEPYAATPAPTGAALAAEFKPVAERMAGAAQPAATGSVTDRLLRMADQIVQVRPVGDPGSNDLAGVTARIEAALTRGAVPEAAQAWDSLPPESRALGEAFGRRLKERAAAETAARKLAGDAVAALDATAR